MVKKLASDLAIGDAVTLPGYSGAVKLTEVEELEDRYIFKFVLNNAPNSCVVLKTIIAELEPFDVKPPTRN